MGGIECGWRVKASVFPGRACSCSGILADYLIESSGKARFHRSGDLCDMGGKSGGESSINGGRKCMGNDLCNLLFQGGETGINGGLKLDLVLFHFTLRLARVSMVRTDGSWRES